MSKANIKFIYNPQKMILFCFENDHMVGGFFGQIAERRLNEILLTDVEINLGTVLTIKKLQ